MNRVALGLLQIDPRDSLENYVGFVSTNSTYFLFSFKLGVFVQTPEFNSGRALLGIGVGF